MRRRVKLVGFTAEALLQIAQEYLDLPADVEAVSVELQGNRAFLRVWSEKFEWENALEGQPPDTISTIFTYSEHKPKS